MSDHMKEVQRQRELNKFGRMANRIALGIPETAKVKLDHPIAVCPTCGKLNVKLAHVMGHINKGSKHPITKEHRKWLSDHMKTVQAQREVDRGRNQAAAVNTEKNDEVVCCLQPTEPKKLPIQLFRRSDFMLTISQAYDLYLADLAGHCTESTIRTRRQRVSKWLKFKNTGSQPVDSFCNQDLNAWTTYSQQKLGMTGNVGILVRKQILIFFKWLEVHKHIPLNPLDIRKLTKLFPKQINRPPFTYEQHQKILEAAKTFTRWPWWADAALLAWHTGMRCSDIATLKWTECDLENGSVNKMAIKTQRFAKTFSVPLEPEALERLKQLRETAKGSPVVFPEMNYTWNIRTMQTMIPHEFRLILNRAGVPKQFSFHSYRHAFISRLINAEVNVKIIQSMTGQSLSVLCAYVTVTPEAQRGAMERAKTV